MLIIKGIQFFAITGRFIFKLTGMKNVPDEQYIKVEKEILISDCVMAHFNA